jgi:tetratricopeptide (TPR) repeat protein
MERVKSIAANVAVAAVLSIILLWGNALYRQHVQFNKGEAAEKGRNFPAAIAGYESAIHMYTPGSSLIEKSAQRLWNIGQVLEQQGDFPRALIAYRSLRSSFYSIAWIYTPGQEWIERCDARIAALVQIRQGR